MSDMPKHDYKFYEQLSALIDGETGGDDRSEIELMLDQVSGDAETRKAWQAFHLARDVVQRDYHASLPVDFCAGVSARIDVEEVFSSVDMIEDSVDTTILPFAARVTPSSAGAQGLEKTNRRWKSAALLGMAASVVFATVAALQLFEKPDQSEDRTTQIARLPSGLIAVESGGDSVNSKAGIISAVLTAGGTHWRDSGRRGHALKVEQRLNSYLTNHLEDATMGKVQGMISHSRVVGYDSSAMRSEVF